MDRKPKQYVAVVGTSDFEDHKFFESKFKKWENENGPIDVIVTGGWAGVDTMARSYAHYREIDTLVFYPKRDQDGDNAIFFADQKIVECADHIILFSTPERSQRIASLIRLTRDMEKRFSVYVVDRNDRF